MPLPEALFTGVQSAETVDETMTTEPTAIAFDPNGDPIGGIPPSLLDSEGRLPAGVLIRRRHTTRCALQRPPASEEPVPFFEFENGCLLYVLKRVCFRTTQSFFVFGLTEYGFGVSHALESETEMAVRVCPGGVPDRFDIMGPLAEVASRAARPPPLGAKPDDYVWLPPETLPVGVEDAHFIPGPASGRDGVRLWNDEYVWRLVPPVRRRHCKIFFRYRMAVIRRWVKPDGTLDGPPQTTLLLPPHHHDVNEDIPGCR